MTDDAEFFTVDEVLNLLGTPGRFQIIQFFIIACQYVPMAFNDFMPIFYGVPPLTIVCREIGQASAKNDTASWYSNRTVVGLNRTEILASCNCTHGMVYEYAGKQRSIIADVSSE